MAAHPGWLDWDSVSRDCLESALIILALPGFLPDRVDYPVDQILVGCYRSMVVVERNLDQYGFSGGNRRPCWYPRRSGSTRNGACFYWGNGGTPHRW